MASEKTIDFNGKSYILTGSGWIEAKSRLRVDASTARKLDKLATVKPDQVDRPDANVLLEKAINARADKQLLRAEQLVRQVLRSTPDNLIAYAVLSGILRDRGRPEQALNETAHVQHLEYPPLLTSRAAA